MRIAITPGEPAGIGPDTVVTLAGTPSEVERVAIADPDVLERRAARLGLPLELYRFDPAAPQRPQLAGELAIVAVPLARAETPGTLDPANAAAVLDTLQRARTGCLDDTFAALVTGPVHKGVINDAGIAFSGHTEYLAGATGDLPVMLLVSETLRVALVTTHLPLASVPGAITGTRIETVTRTLAQDLRRRFAIARPRILVLGLNPHAGEGGHLGREEIEVIEPALARLRAEGLSVHGPLPADTAFTPRHLDTADAVLAMYHDQGLPVLKYTGFGQAVNVTLGLPFIRTSVDHGTALDLAASGRAEAGSLVAAFALATRLAAQERTA